MLNFLLTIITSPSYKFMTFNVTFAICLCILCIMYLPDFFELFLLFLKFFFNSLQTTYRHNKNQFKIQESSLVFLNVKLTQNQGVHQLQTLYKVTIVFGERHTSNNTLYKLTIVSGERHTSNKTLYKLTIVSGETHFQQYFIQVNYSFW